MANVSHTSAFKAQSDFAPEAKLKIGSDIWTAETAGSRFYAQVLAQKPSTIQKVLDLASKLEQPITAKAAMAHLKWLYTDGQLEVDGVSYVVQAKTPKAAKATKEPAKEAKGKFKAKIKVPAKAEAKAAATHQRRMVKTKALKRAA